MPREEVSKIAKSINMFWPLLFSQIRNNLPIVCEFWLKCCNSTYLANCTISPIQLTWLLVSSYLLSKRSINRVVHIRIHWMKWTVWVQKWLSSDDITHLVWFNPIVGWMDFGEKKKERVTTRRTRLLRMIQVLPQDFKEVAMLTRALDSSIELCVWFPQLILQLAMTLHSTLSFV
jgi:hypothetical protein